MAPYLDGLAANLQSREYSRRSIRRQLCNTDSFGYWLSEQNLTVTSITDEVVGRYVGGLHRSARAGYPKGYRPHNARGLPRLLELLCERGVLPPVAAPTKSAPDRLQEFDRYLERVRGAARATRAGYLREMRRFGRHVFGEADPTGRRLALRMWPPTSRGARQNWRSLAGAIRSRRCGCSCATWRARRAGLPLSRSSRRPSPKSFQTNGLSDNAGNASASDSQSVLLARCIGHSFRQLRPPPWRLASDRQARPCEDRVRAVGSALLAGEHGGGLGIVSRERLSFRIPV